jgi:CSLREA domain-containing protein
MMRRICLTYGMGLAATALAVAFLSLASPHPAQALGGEVFVVDSDADGADDSTGDCTCETAGGECTLRAAIEEANACSGPQTIRFAAPATIEPLTALPTITDDGTEIDGSDQWVSGLGLGCPGVQLDGEGRSFSGLAITASDTAVFGITIIRFGNYGILLHSGAQNNQIGGAGSHQRNVISRNGASGVLINGSTTTSNTIEANYIGTNPEGTSVVWDVADWGNGQHGVSQWYGSGNVVTGNLVANNGWSGVAADYVGGSAVISYNRIGMDIYGEPLGNSFNGIHIAHTSWPTLYYNDVAFNKRGIVVEGGSYPWVYHNLIYSNDATSLSPPHGGGILIRGDYSKPLVNYNEILSNTARYGGGIAVENGAGPAIHHNTIRENDAYAAAGGLRTSGGGGIYVNQASAGIEHNRILSNTASGYVDDYPLPDGAGVLLETDTGGTVSDNEFRGNVVDGNAGGGGGMCVLGESSVQIRRNSFVANTVDTSSYGGSAIDIRSHSLAPHMLVEANWLSDNNTMAGGAVYLMSSSYISLTNNVIVDNWDSGLFLHSSGSHVSAVNNTVAQNSGSGIELEDSSLWLFNTILVSNTLYGIRAGGSWSLARNCNDVWGNGVDGASWTTVFDFEEDPLFFDAGGGMYALRPGSPCIDQAGSAYAPPSSYNEVSRPQGAGCDIGAYEMLAPLYLPLTLRGY